MLTGFLPGELEALGIPPEALETAYGDVVDAFREYIANHSEGRGFLLVGHSHSGLLRRLVAEEIEPDDAQHERLIGAHLLGTSVAMPHGADVGGEFLGGTGWGLHPADVSLTQQDLVDLAGWQGHAWLSR